MKITRLALILMACAGLMLVSVQSAYAFDRIPTMTIAELDKGMSGIGKTVIQGTKIEDFNFEILGILQKGGFNGGAMILVRCWGPVIDASGGIAAGYSGSPMYIDGKLIGALSAGWNFSKGDIAGVTPIHEMLKTFSYPGASNNFWNEGKLPFVSETELSKPITHGDKSFDKVALFESERQVKDADIDENTLVMVATKTPLIAGGISDSLFPLIKKKIEDRMPYIEVLQGPGSGVIPANYTDAYLAPGSAIGVQVVSGDIDLTAIGTLTYIDEDGRILAFGHPFFMSGFLEMPLTSARIIQTIPSLSASFKVGEAVEMVGRIEQDRGTCVAGTIGVPAEMLDIKVTVIDEDLNWKNTYNSQVVKDENMMSMYMMTVPMQAITWTIDRTGSGMMDVSFTVTVDGMEKPISMNNIFYGQSGYAEWYAVSELASVMDTLTFRNIYKKADIKSIDMTIRIHDENKTLSIIKAKSILPETSEESTVQEEEIESTGPEAVEETILLGGHKTIDFKPRHTPERALVELATNPFGREMLRLNAGDEVLTAVDEYLSGKETDEGEEFYEVPKYYPGDTIEATVILQPYRDDPIEKTLTLKIPDDYPAGVYDVSISGGNMYGGGFMFDPFMMGMSMGGGMMGGYGVSPLSLDEMLEQVTKRDPNNTLVISLAPVYPQDPYAQLKEGYKLPEPIKTVITLDGVVQGAYFLPIEVLSRDGEEPTTTGGEEILDNPAEETLVQPQMPPDIAPAPEPVG